METVEQKSSDITLKDVRKTAFEMIDDLRTGKIDIETAKVANSLLNSAIETAKTEVGFLNALPKQIKETMNFDQVKEVSAGFKDRDVELENTLKGIENKKSKPYEFEH